MGELAQKLSTELKELELKRKNKEISAKEFYAGLLNLLQNLVNALEEEDIDENQIRSQIPLLLTFIKSQIKNMAARGD
jgi:hypothetical protein